MSVAVIGDLHFGMRITDDRFIDYQVAEWLKFVDYCKKSDIKTIVQLGDFFDNRSYISVKILNIILNELLENDIKMWILVGNHDTLFKNTVEVNTPDLIFRRHPNVRVVDEAREITLDGTPFLFVPWINKENIAHTKQVVKESTAQYAFGHLELNGFEMTNGIECKDKMSPALFKKFKKVMTGHFHLVQEKKNIHYLGSFYQTTWADCGDQKFAYMLTPRPFELTPVPMARPIFKKIYLTEDKPITPDHVDSATDSYVKIYLNYKMKAKDEKLLTKLQEGAIKCDVVDMRLLLEAPGDEEVENEDFLEIFDGFMELQDELDADLKEGVTRLIKKTYNEAMQNAV